MSRYDIISQKGAVWYINRGLKSVKLIVIRYLHKALTTYYYYYYYCYIIKSLSKLHYLPT